MYLFNFIYNIYINTISKMALAIPIIGFTMLMGKMMSNNESVSSREEFSTRNAVIQNDKPSGNNIYTSNMAKEANALVLQKSLQNYSDATNPSETNILPPLFNTFSVKGTQQNLTTPNSTLLNNINEVNRRENVFDVKKEKPVNTRPMFNQVYESIIVSNQESNALSNSEYNKEIDKSGVNPLTGLSYSGEHNNMVPFFGSNVKQNIEKMTNVSKLELYSGNSDLFFHKKETKPLYTLMKQDINGTANITNLELDRYIPSNLKQGEKPFEQDRVSAPKAGTFENKIRTIGKTVDELRVASKPKLTYAGRTSGGQFGNIRGVHGQVEKYSPDTFYKNDPERWIKTTGVVIAEKPRENFENLKSTHRQNVSDEPYYGSSYSGQNVKNIQRIINEKEADAQTPFGSIAKETIRQQLKTDYVRNSNPIVHKDSEHDYGKSSYTTVVTQRHLNGETKHYDINVHSQNAGNKMYFQDEAKNTIKQTTLKSDNSGNMKPVFDKGGIVAHDIGIHKWDAKATNKQALINNKYIGIASKDEGMGYTISNYDAKTTGKEIITNNSNYTGNGNSLSKSTISRHNYNSAEISDKKESVLSERQSGPNKYQICAGSDLQGEFKYTDRMNLKEESSFRRAQDMKEFINPFLPSRISTPEKIGFVENKRETQSEQENNRLTPTLITSQLQNNPFVINGPNRI